MNNLSKIEKVIIDCLVESDVISEQFENSKLVFDSGLLDQKNGCNIETLIQTLFHQGGFLDNVGLLIDFDKTLNEYTIHIMEPESKESEFPGNWDIFQKVNYLLVKTSNFLNQLEREGYLDKVSVRNNFDNKRTPLPYTINTKDHSQKTLQIKNKATVNEFLNCFVFIYIPNHKLIEFKKNNYKTPESIFTDKEMEISRSNLRIAKFGLYMAVISSIASLIAIVITIYSLCIPATVKINDDQVNGIKKLILKTNREIKSDTIYIKK